VRFSSRRDTGAPWHFNCYPLATIAVRVRIVRSPRERELDGLPLDSMIPGLVRDVSPSVATWLIAEGYAVLEMRVASDSLQPDPGTGPPNANDRRKKL
jgi:hypothetical protein